MEFSKIPLYDRSKNQNDWKFLCNGVVLCEVKTYGEAFCSNYGNIRDIVKQAKSTTWWKTDISKVTGHKLKNKTDFKGIYPDTNYNYVGSMISFKEFKTEIFGLFNSKYVKI